MVQVRGDDTPLATGLAEVGVVNWLKPAMKVKVPPTLKEG
jgi:hypothetical protein